MTVAAYPIDSDRCVNYEFAMHTLIRGLLSPSNQATFDALKFSNAACGNSFIGFLANIDDVDITMKEYGLSASAQKFIRNTLAPLDSSMNRYTFKSTVDNSESKHSTHGDLVVAITQINVKACSGESLKHTLLAPNYTVTVEPTPTIAASRSPDSLPLCRRSTEASRPYSFQKSPSGRCINFQSAK